MIGDLYGSLGSRYFLNVVDERTSFASCALRVQGWSLVWNALLTKKLPMFLRRLNEINGGCENILPVTGSFGMMDFTGRVKCKSEWNSL